MHEGDYNQLAAQCEGHLLLDKQTIHLTGQTPIEICDLLSKDRQLIHVKRHLGSSDLSHLFAQGLVSAEVLQTSIECRTRARERIADLSGASPDYAFFSNDALHTGDFEIVYAIIERWRSRSFSQALPFFSKVNLREASQQLTSRGFNVGVKQIDADATSAN
jgi:uncharacterized protein (TIGR04141 family)